MSKDHKKDGVCEGKDMLVPGPDLGNGVRTFTRHLPDHTVVGGVMKPLKEGEPILDGGVFMVKPRGDGTPICDVENIDIPGRPAWSDPSRGLAWIVTPTTQLQAIAEHEIGHLLGASHDTLTRHPQACVGHGSAVQAAYEQGAKR